MALTEQEKQQRMREARRRLSAQRNRAGQLRGRVVAASLICFALLWSVVFVQMATGSDPVLGEKAAEVAPKPKRHRGASRQSAQPASEGQAATPPEVKPAPESKLEPEVQAEPEPQPEVELEPLTTSQS